MVPEILEDTRGHIVGVIVALSYGRYEASVRVSPYSYLEKSLVFQRSFDQLEKARYWVRANGLMGAVEEDYGPQPPLEIHEAQDIEMRRY